MKCFSEVSSSDVVLEVKVIGDRMKRTKTLKKKQKQKKQEKTYFSAFEHRWKHSG